MGFDLFGLVGRGDSVRLLRHGGGSQRRLSLGRFQLSQQSHLPVGSDLRRFLRCPGRALRFSGLLRGPERLPDPRGLFLGSRNSLRGGRCQDYSTLLAPNHLRRPSNLALELEGNHAKAIAARPVICEFRDSHVPGTRHDTLVDPTLQGIDAGGKHFPLGPHLLKPRFSRLPFSEQLRRRGSTAASASW